MRLRSLFASSRRYYRHWLPASRQAGMQPLLDAQTLDELATLARSLPHRLYETPRRTGRQRIGETLSVARGRGFEFEENRAYQPGDEPRWLNWRSYARSGQLHTKVFTEEHRPQLFILVDRRAAMCFGTRRQLKAALAAKIAALHAWQAQQAGLSVGALLLGQAPQWLAPGSSTDALHALLQALAAPCPPLPFEADQPALDECLLEMTWRLPPGCAVVLLSDFSDLDPDAAVGALQQLGEVHRLQAVQILDPAEQHLPGGNFWIEAPRARQPFRVGEENRRLRARYAEAFHARQGRLAACLRACDIPLRTCSTADDLRRCLDLPDDDAAAR